MSKAQILQFEKIPSVERGAGITTKPLAGQATGAQGISTGVTTFNPGTAIPLHTHNVEESVTLIEGEGVCEIEGKTQRVKPFDTTYVPAGVPHRFRNDSKSTMRILWVYGSTHVTRTLTETGETMEHMSPQDRRVGRTE